MDRSKRVHIPLMMLVAFLFCATVCAIGISKVSAAEKTSNTETATASITITDSVNSERAGGYGTAGCTYIEDINRKYAHQLPWLFNKDNEKHRQIIEYGHLYGKFQTLFKTLMLNRMILRRRCFVIENFQNT